MSALQLIAMVGTFGWNLYVWPSVAIQWIGLTGGKAPDMLRAIRAELRPFALPLALAYSVPGVLETHSAWSYGSLGFAVLNWLLLRHLKDDDDDRWKRRKQKLAEKVAEVGGKLQVVPAGAS